MPNISIFSRFVSYNIPRKYNSNTKANENIYSNTLTLESFVVIKSVTKPKWHNADHYTYTRARTVILHPTLSPKSVTRNGKCVYYSEYVTYMRIWNVVMSLLYLRMRIVCAEAEDKRWTYEYIALASGARRSVQI